MNSDNSFTTEVMIAACNKAIDSGSWSGSGLAWVYNNLGKAYFLKQDYGRAVSEYDHALKLDPADAYAYCGRGITKNAQQGGTGDDDIAHARRLDSSLCND